MDDENSPTVLRRNVEQILAHFLLSSPRGLITKQTESQELRYRFNIGASAGFDTALATKVQTVNSDKNGLHELLLKLARARFEDWPSMDETSGPLKFTNFVTTWRGSERRGQLSWLSETSDKLPPPITTLHGPPFYDWEIIIVAPDVTVKEIPHAPAYAIWQPAPLTEEEKEILYRLIALRSDSSLFAEYSGTARAAETSLASQAERIWTRIYIDQATFITSEYSHVFNSAARSSLRLTEALSHILAPTMGARYPEHPVFAERISDNDVALLVSNAFGAGSINDPLVQRALGNFASPLGLAALRNNAYALHTHDELLSRPWVIEILSMADAADGEVVPLESIRHRLRRTPYGLTRESRQLILAALVSQRLIELTTVKGSLIGRRDLDQSLRWDEIAGFCRSTKILHTAEELTLWARLLTNNEELPVITSAEAREETRTALKEWLVTWQSSDLLHRLDALPDEALTIHISNMAATVRKTFCSAAKAVEELLTDNVTLDEGLQRIVDAFSDSTEIYYSAAEQLRALTEFVNEIDHRLSIRDYLSAAEPTQIYQIESARRELSTLSEDIHYLFDEELRQRFDLLWQVFQSYYIEHYINEHNRMAGSELEADNLNHIILSKEWHEFKTASQELSITNKSDWEEIERLFDRSSRERCMLPVEQILTRQPFCDCGFRLAHALEKERVAEEIGTTIRQGRNSYRHTIIYWSKNLVDALEEIILNEPEEPTIETAERLIMFLKDQTLPDYLSYDDLTLIERATQSTVLPPVRVNLPVETYGLLTRQELRGRLDQWVEELPEHPAFIQLVNTEMEADQF
jgi:hypothetical protein